MTPIEIKRLDIKLNNLIDKHGPLKCKRFSKKHKELYDLSVKSTLFPLQHILYDDGLTYSTYMYLALHTSDKKQLVDLWTVGGITKIIIQKNRMIFKPSYGNHTAKLIVYLPK